MFIKYILIALAEKWGTLTYFVNLGTKTTKCCFNSVEKELDSLAPVTLVTIAIETCTHMVTYETEKYTLLITLMTDKYILIVTLATETYTHIVTLATVPPSPALGWSLLTIKFLKLTEDT